MDDDDEKAIIDAMKRHTKTMMEKVTKIFRVFGEDRCSALCTGLSNETAFVIKDALVAESALPAPLAYDIGFHLSDWHQEAAVLVALHLFPERFTSGEVEAAILKVLSHAPQHAATAAALYEMPVSQSYVKECVEESWRKT